MLLSGRLHSLDTQCWCLGGSVAPRICAELKRDLAEFNARRLNCVEFPYVFADATYVKARVRG